VTAPFRLRAYYAAEFGGMFRKLSVAISALGLVAGALALGVQVGLLKCDVAGGFGFVFGSSRAINCTFAPANHPTEHYVGSIDRFGVDIGYVAGGVLIWLLVAPTANIAPGSLAGIYAGVTGSATIGVGLGANVMVGGSANSIILQPLSFQGTTGLNVAAGLAAMTLTYDAPGIEDGGTRRNQTPHGSTQTGDALVGLQRLPDEVERALQSGLPQSTSRPIRGGSARPDELVCMDSSLEGSGFELPVPVRQAKLTRSGPPSCSGSEVVGAAMMPPVGA